MTAIPTTYRVYPDGCDPDDINAYHFAVDVEWRGGDRYAVCHAGNCLRQDGRRWSYEPNPSSRTDRFKQTYRMPLERALRLAQREAERTTVYGKTWQQLRAEGRL